MIICDDSWPDILWRVKELFDRKKTHDNVCYVESEQHQEEQKVPQKNYFS